VWKLLMTGIGLACLTGALYAGPSQNNFDIPQDAGLSAWQQLYDEYPIFARIQCRKTGGLWVTFEYKGQGAGCHICFTVTGTDNYVFTPQKMTTLKTGQYWSVRVRELSWYFPNNPGIAISLERVMPIISGGHPPMLRPCKPFNPQS
jgi:hypothetical protein